MSGGTDRSVVETTDGSPPSAGNGDPEPVVDVRDLSVSLGDATVLSDVDLAVDPGSFVGLVGPNGAGKTTLLRAIRGTVTPDAGTVRIAGDPLGELSARAVGRRVASVPQGSSLSFDFPVRNVVEMGRTPHVDRFGSHDADDAAAVREAMATTDVARFADRPITALSGGERGRVLLARALAQETPVLLLDEPTASLDVNHAVRTLQLVRDLVDDGTAAVAAIHDLDAAARFCDEIALLADGRVRAAGSPDVVLTADAVGGAFDATAFVGRNPATGSASVTSFPPPEPDRSAPTDSRRVHVLGTGPEAARVVARLAAAGYRLSVGVVPDGDVAERAATDAGATTITVPPFERIDDPERRRARRTAVEADVLVAIGDQPPANEAVLDATRETTGSPAVLAFDEGVSTRVVLDAVAGGPSES